MNQRLEQLRQQLREDSSSRLFFQLGELLRREGECEEAAEVLRAGLENFPRYVAAWVSLGRALSDLSSLEAAESAFETAMTLDPENPIAARMLGEAAMGREDWLQAIKHLKLARVFSPNDEALEESVRFVEQRLSENGELIGGPTVEPIPVDEVLHDDIPEQESVEQEDLPSPQDDGPSEDINQDVSEDLNEDMLPAVDEETPFGVEPEPSFESPDDADDEDEVHDAPVDEPAADDPPAFESVDDVEEHEAAADDVDSGDAPVDDSPFVEDEHASFEGHEDHKQEDIAEEPEPVLSGGDPFEVGPETTTASAGDEVFSLSEDDPFRAEPPTGDTGVFMLGDDVFGESPESRESGEIEAVSDVAEFPEDGASAVDEDFPAEPSHEGERVTGSGFESVPPEPLAEVAEDVAQAQDDAPDTPEAPGTPVSIETDAASLVDVDERAIPEPVAVEEAAFVASESEDFPPEKLDEPELPAQDAALPLPTLTLARLALDQGDQELAVQTLQNVLLAEPGNEEAALLLAEITAVDNDATDLPDAKIRVLQSWLTNLKQAAEERAR